MARRTKKVGISGRLRQQYGVRVRKRIQDIETASKVWHTCPKCQYQAVKRVSTGIWSCRHCGLKFAGGAYQPVAARVLKREEELTAETVGPSPPKKGGAVAKALEGTGPVPKPPQTK